MPDGRGQGLHRQDQRGLRPDHPARGLHLAAPPRVRRQTRPGATATGSPCSPRAPARC
ncbi:hypothetical protein G5V59_21190 [Nocardioides sp. W3-2-3]|nr:hypothetical protein [Nocardioides convexus]